MRLITLVLALCWASLAAAQIPSFSSTAPKRLTSSRERADLSARLRDYERVDFRQADLLTYLRAAPGERPLRLQIGAHDWTMRLEPFDLRSPDYTLVVQTPQGVVELPRSATPTFRGSTSDGERVVITLAEDFVSGWVEGASGRVNFQSEWVNSATARHQELVVYRAEDELKPAESACELRLTNDTQESHEDEGPSGKTGEARPQVGQCFQVQLAIASDFLMYQAYGNNVATLEARNLSVMAGVEGDYGSSFADDYFFPVVQQFISTCASCDPWTASTEAGDLLDSFTSWGRTNFTAQHDLGQLWTRRNFNGSTVGIAWVGALCTPSRYHTLQDFTPNATFIRVTTSHEIGHNFDCDHDAAGSLFIMAPAVQVTSTWSPLSISTVNGYAPFRPCLSTGSCSGGGGGGGGGSTSPPVASFTGSPLNICSGQQVNFQNSSSGATSYAWSFPGGTPATSTATNPNVSYSLPGSYNVTLVATNAGGSNTSQKFNYVTVNPNPTGGFTYTPSGALTYQFLNSSQFATNYQWDFGDGTGSTVMSPVHTFPNAGVYQVTLLAMSGCGVVSITQTVSVMAPPVAGFSANVRQGCSPLTVSFLDQSSGSPTSFQWSFPGGTPATSNQRNPTVVYHQPGSFDVVLTASNTVGNDIESRSGYIVVAGAPTAGFGVSLSGNTVTITNQASTSVGVSYSFGDGGVSNLPNPVYTYSSAGTFTITQTVAGTCGPVTATQQVTILSPPVASFTLSATTTCIGRPVTITSTSTGAPTALFFQITLPGGAVVASTQSPFAFTPSLAGTYGVRLTASNGAGSHVVDLPAAFVILAAPTSDFNTTLSGNTATFAASITPVLPGFTPIYTWDFGDGQTGTGANPSHVFAQAGTYTVTVSTNNGCSPSSRTRTITVGAVPTAVINRQPGGTLCVGANVSYTAVVSGTATSITWSLPGSSTPVATGMAVQVSYAAAGTYAAEVTVCNSLGCNTATLSGGTTVLAAPSAGFTVSVSGATVTVTSSAVGATGVTYTFAPGATSTSPTSSYTYTQGGTYVISQTVTGPCGQNSTSQTITIGGAPTVTASVIGSGPFCVGQPISLRAVVTGTFTSVTWSIPGSNTVNQSGVTAQAVFNGPGSYVATVTACNAIGCSAPALVSPILVVAGPSAGFTSSISGLSATLTTTAQNAGTVSYSFGDGNSSSQPNPSHTYAQAGSYRILQTVTSACGQDTTSLRVAVGGAPTPGFTSAQQACVGAGVSFSDQSLGSPTAWLWNFPGGTPSTSTSRNPVVVYAAPGTYDVTLTVTNGLGSNSTTRGGAITILGQPTASFTASVNGNAVALVPVLSGATSSTFDFGNGVTAPGTTTGYTYPLPGTYVIRLTAVGTCGTISSERTVTIAPAVVRAVVTASTQSVCPGESVVFGAGTSVGAVSYQWSFPGGTPSTSTEASPTVRYLQPGNYTVVLVASNGITRDTATLVNYVTVRARPQAAFTPDINMLAVIFSNQSTAATSYSWSFGDGATSTIAAPTHSYAGAGTYDVRLVARGSCGVDSFQLAVTVSPGLPNAAYTASTTSGCAPLVVQFEDRSTGEPTSWLWTLTSVSGITLTSTERNPLFTLVDPDVYSVVLQVRNSAGANSSVNLNAIQVIGAPEALATVQSVNGLSVSFTSASTRADSIRWDFGDGSISTLEAPRHTYATGGTYTVLFSAFGRCGTSRDTVFATVLTSGTRELPTGASVVLYPNPAQNFTALRVSGLDGVDLRVRVTDLLGREVFVVSSPATTGARQLELLTQDWAAGSYFVTVHGEGLDYTLPLVRLE